MSLNSVSCEDILFKDLIIVLWHRKITIIGIVAVAMILATAFGLNSAKVYEGSIILRPIILFTNNEGNNVLIESLENIKTLIATKALNQQIFEELSKSGRNVLSSDLVFKTKVTSGLDFVEIFLEYNNTSDGIEILKTLKKTLSDYYQPRLKEYVLEKEIEVKRLRERLSFFEMKKSLLEQNIWDYNLRIKTIREQLKQFQIGYEEDLNWTSAAKEQIKKKKFEGIVSFLNERKIFLSSFINYQTLITDIESLKLDEENLLIGTIEGGRQSLQDEVNRSERNLTRLHGRINNGPFVVEKKASFNESPIKPNNKKLFLIVAALSFMISIVSVLAFEYLSSVAFSENSVRKK